MVNRVSAAGLQVRSYFHRYTDDAIDLCDVFGSYVASAKAKLDEISKIVDLAGKPRGIDGSEVEKMVQAGRIDEVAVSGMRWEEFIRTRLTGKLGMDVSFTAEDLARNADAAVPYTMDGDKRLRVPQFPVSVAPAGGINASISGMANWVRFLLGRGEFEGQRLLSAPLVREMQTPRVHVATLEFSEIGDTYYGLGFRCHHYRGERAVGHSGGWIGWSTLMTLLPDRDIGVVVLTNRAPGLVVEIVTNFVLDRLLGKPLVPWFDRFRERRRAFIAQLETDRQTRATARRAGTRPSHHLADYAGDYEHPGYGQDDVVGGSLDDPEQS